MEDTNDVGAQQKKDVAAIKTCAGIAQDVHEAIKGLPEYIRYGDKAFNTQADKEANIVFNDCSRDYVDNQSLPSTHNKETKSR